MTGRDNLRAAGGRRRCLTAVVVLAGCALALAGCRQPGFGVAADTGAGPPAYASLPSQPDTYLGVYERGIPQTYQRVEQFAAAVGRQPNLVLSYGGWGEPFPGPFARTAFQHGATPIIDLDPTGVTVESIAEGLHDDYLRSYALAVRSFGHPVVISFAHEMNGSWYPWGWNRTPSSQWIEAWQHLVTVFRSAGADNVIWLWVVNRVTTGEGPIGDWWPGAAYVTWTGIDGYYEQPTQNFASVFDPTITAIRKLTGKPILISETAVGQVAGQAAKIPGLFAGIRSHHLLGLLWFDKAQHDGMHHQDWRLEGHQSAVELFRRALRAEQ